MPNFAFGDVELLDWLADETARIDATPGDYHVRLFQNPWIPAAHPVPADLTECTFNGYAGLPWVGTGWSAGILGDAASSSCLDTYNFVPAGGGGGQNVWGYYLTDSFGNIAGVEKFLAVQVTVEGITIPVIPRIQLKAC